MFFKVLSIVIISFLSFQNCYLHHANISGDGYGIKTVINFQKEIKSQLPILIEFDPRQKDKIQSYLKRKGQNVEVSDELISTYYSEEIISKFKNSEYFTHSPNANMKIKIDSSIEEIRVPLFSRAAQIVSLGLFPAVTRTYGRIEFNLFDKEHNRIIKTYKYKIEHRHLQAFTSAVLGAILPSFSERFDHSQNEKSYAVMRVSFNQFNIDLINDLNKDKELLAKFKYSRPVHHALYFDPGKEKRDSKLDNLFFSNLEEMFINHKLNLVERTKIKRIIEEIKLSQYGLTESERLKFGKLASAENLIEVSDVSPSIKDNKTIYNIRCISVETGKILWSETISVKHSSNQTDAVSDSIDNLLRELQLKGVL